MDKRFYSIYQYIAVLILLPIAVCIWYKSLLSIKYTALMLSLPVITAYIVPAVGTNFTNLWEFNNKKFMIGKFRIYHGFVLGSVTSIFGYLIYKISPVWDGGVNAVIISLFGGAFIAFWNVIYDIYAVKCGFIVVNNKSAYEKKSAHEIVFEYAPIYFYCFGFIYCFYIKLLECLIILPENGFFYVLIILMHLVSIFVPTLIYACISKKINGYWGICKYTKENNE